MLEWQDILRKEGIAPDQTLVMLHSPSPPEFAQLLPGLVRSRRGVLESYQATHAVGAARTLARGRPYVASFVMLGKVPGGNRSRMVFVGLYENHGARRLSHGQIMEQPEMAYMSEAFGVGAKYADRRTDLEDDWFDLRLSERLETWQGRVTISVRLTPSYVRRGENLDAPILSICEEGIFDDPPPPWREIDVSAAFVRDMPMGWANKLREWAGVYLIYDTRDGMRYVGSAYGADNIYGRWQQHVAGDQGVTVELERRDPAGFRFSILERVSPDMTVDDITTREHTWMRRLHTRGPHGLNR